MRGEGAVLVDPGEFEEIRSTDRGASTGVRVYVANSSGQQKRPHSSAAREAIVVPMEDGGITVGDDLQTQIEAVYNTKERNQPTIEVRA